MLALQRSVKLLPPPRLPAEPVQGATLTLEGVDDVHGGDGLSLGVLRVCDRVANDVLEEDLQHASRLLVDEARDALDAPSAGETANRRLGYALDVVTKDLAMTLGAPLAESLASFATARHDVLKYLSIYLSIG